MQLRSISVQTKRHFSPEPTAEFSIDSLPKGKRFRLQLAPEVDGILCYAVFQLPPGVKTIRVRPEQGDLVTNWPIDLGFVSYKRAFMKEIAKDSRDCTYWQLIIINRCPKGTF